MNPFKVQVKDKDTSSFEGQQMNTDNSFIIKQLKMEFNGLLERYKNALMYFEAKMRVDKEYKRKDDPYYEGFKDIMERMNNILVEFDSLGLDYDYRILDSGFKEVN